PSLNYRVDITVEEDFKNKHIHSIGKISRDDVFNNLNNEVLVFPSYIETFGLPLAEGRQLNSIIFAADTPFAREILDGYHNSYFFDTFDEKELGRLMIDSIKGRVNKYPQSEDVEAQNNSWERVHKLLLSSSLS